MLANCCRVELYTIEMRGLRITVT